MDDVEYIDGRGTCVVHIDDVRHVVRVDQILLALYKERQRHKHTTFTERQGGYAGVEGYGGGQYTQGTNQETWTRLIKKGKGRK